MRTRSNLSPLLPQIYLGYVLAERYDTVTKTWVVTSNTPQYSGTLATRRLSGEVCQDVLHPGPPYKHGGPFSLFRYMWKNVNPVYCKGICYPSATLRYTYDGSFMPSFTPITSPTYWTPESLESTWQQAYDLDTTSHATRGYNTFSPLKPRVDVGQTLAEIHEIPRMVLSTAKHFRKIWYDRGGGLARYRNKPWYERGSNLASDWLSINFGWIPFLKTLRDIHKLNSHINGVLRRLRTHNNRWEQRGGTLVEDASSSHVPNLESGSSSRTWPNLSGAFGNAGNCAVVRTVERRIWFKARYKYYIPTLEPGQGFPLRLVRRLYGLELSPGLLYDLIPFSWLADWYQNVGDMIANQDMGSYGGLVTKDAYLMDTLNDKFTISVKRQVGINTLNASWDCTRTRKHRKCQLSPYGFDAHLSGLSSWQASILTALGWNPIRKRFGR